MISTLKQYGWSKPQKCNEAGHTSCIMESLKGYSCYKQDMINLDYFEITSERRWGRLSTDEYNDLLPYIHYNDKEPEELKVFLDFIKMSKKEFYNILEKKPFSSSNMPQINWELANKLPHHMDRELLLKSMKLAYERTIP